ncbi:MAG: ABC transporter ATP-binding protein [Chloroflexi bacterium]|nr:ABC transporter ATP-binding protein [Chloroflexota bacterium]
MNMISLNHLTKQFAETVAVKNLSFDVNAGEIFGLIGPDGAGKTTTLRVIATAMNPTSGAVTVDGRDTVRDAEAAKQVIGYMPQRFALYPDLTVLENLNFFADLFGASRDERLALIARLLGFARLTEFQTRLARNLSGGMQKKLALAASLMHRPRVLLLDEPTTGVDPISRREFWDLLSEVHLQGVTIIIATPYLDEAERCTRVGLMYRGEMIACDTPSAIREHLGAVALEAQSSQAKLARRAIETGAGVLSVSTHGDSLRVLVDRAEREAELREVWNTHGIAIDHVRVVKPRLEDAFVLMTTQRERKPEGAP